MSYLTIEEHMEEQVKKIRDHRGERNPHFGHIMKQESREAIANKQRQRYEMLRQIVDNKTVTEARVREIIKETINEYLAKNSTDLKNNNRPNIPL